MLPRYMACLLLRGGPPSHDTKISLDPLFSTKANSTTSSYIPLSYHGFLKAVKANLSLRLRLNVGHNHNNPCLANIHTYSNHSTVARCWTRFPRAVPCSAIIKETLRSVLAPLDLGAPEISNSSTQFAMCETSPAGSDNQTYNTC